MDKIVLGMASLRLLSGFIEIIAALLMLKYNKVETAFEINSLLALVGPSVLMLVTSLGLVGLAEKLHFSRMFMVVLGVAIIFFAVRKA